MPDASAIDKKYIYKVSRSGMFLGVLQKVKSDFSYTQDINTAGSALVITVADTADKQFEAPDPIQTEEGNNITDEAGQVITTERQPDIVGNLNSKALIRNNNDIQVYEISPTYPNGILVFSGWISRWSATYGASDDITINCLSNASELDNYLIMGSQVNDVSQAVQNSSIQVGSNSKSGALTFCGENLVTGAGANLSAILLKLAAISSSTPVTFQVDLYNTAIEANGGVLPMSTVQQTVTSTSPADYTFTFPSAIFSNIGQGFFFTVKTVNDTYGLVYYQNTDIYANGSMYVADYSGGGGSTAYNITPTGVYPASDLYFKTYYTAGATTTPYSSQDPTAILRDIIDSYVARGGTINYASGSTVLTGTTRSYTFKVNTVLEGIKKCLELAPFDWYWYVNPASNTLYFKETNVAADHMMTYGRHIQSLNIQASVEEAKNKAVFTGGDTGGNVYLYQSLDDNAALVANAGRVGLIRLTDNRVTLSDTADSLMQTYLDANGAENYQSTITVNAKAYDITLFDPGETIGFQGFGSYVDLLILQIVHIERHPDYVVLGLGVLPRRADAKVEDIQRALNDVETIYNPSAPS